eukprot:6842-Heterococcus_DN1.PRE.5
MQQYVQLTAASLYYQWHMKARTTNSQEIWRSALGPVKPSPPMILRTCSAWEHSQYGASVKRQRQCT